jgi:tripartite-type tricarboxylate transporter receptor subunit TctC
MKQVRRRILRLAPAAVAAACAFRSASARADAGWPTRPVRVIVPFPPGGGTDILARLVAQRLGGRLGAEFYVENVAGAGGNTGAGVAARAAPDGHTLLFVFGSFVVNPSLFDKVPYDPVKDFEPVTLAAATTTVLIVHPSVPASSFAEFVDHVRATPGRHGYATGGFGTQPHLVGEQLRVALGLDFVHVPFGGAAPAMVSVAGGHTPIGFSSMAAALPYVRDGRVRALAVTSRDRSPSLPDVPTMAECGHPDLVGDSWVGVLVPAGTAHAVVAALHREITAIIAEPEMNGRLASLGYEPIASSPEAFAGRIAGEAQTWRKVIAAADIKVR